MSNRQPASLEDLLRLHLAAGISGALFDTLVAHFGSVGGLLEASMGELSECGLCSPAVVRRIASARSVEPGAELKKVSAAGARVVGWGSAEYPANLRFIFDPPLVLYVMGTLRAEDMLAVAVVGSRRCSAYGRGMSERLAGELASRGFTVVSGLAQGIDAAAHRGALRSGGRTLAVLGSGLACIYPPENRALAEEVAQSGAVLSELPMEAEPDRWNFPARNRLISGLSLGVVVVEAARQSGALITARWAAEQGREVFAVPGQAGSPMAQGPHALLRDGAHLVECTEDVLDGLGPLPEAFQSVHGQRIQDVRALPLSDNEQAVLRTLGTEPKHIDQIIEESGLEASAVASTLLMLEVKRAVVQHPGKTFTRL